VPLKNNPAPVPNDVTNGAFDLGPIDNSFDEGPGASFSNTAASRAFKHFVTDPKNGFTAGLDYCD
jgi:hypothetical protein